MGIPRDKCEQEDVVVHSLITRLSGVHAVLLERPDRLPASERTYPDLTTDALLELDGSAGRQRWAVDVTSLAAPASHHLVPRALTSGLDELAVRHNVRIDVLGDQPNITEVRRILRQVDAAIQEAGQGLEHCIQLHGIEVAWRPAISGESVGAEIRAMVMESPSALLSDQMAATLRSPLSRKATKQASVARQQGLRTSIAIDRVGHDGIAQGMHWLSRHRHSIADSVSQVLAGLAHDVDAVILRDYDDDWCLLSGFMPGFDADG